MVDGIKKGGICLIVEKFFSGKEKNYDKNRPAYPTQLISFLYDTIGFKDSSVNC